MKNRKKVTKKEQSSPGKRTIKQNSGSNDKKPIWLFSELDRAGSFAFDVTRPCFEHKLFMDKMISYSGMTWNEILAQTHDKGKSKHHFLNYDELSGEAKERITRLSLDEDTDRIFSFAFQNKLRIIGFRQDEFFYVKWYDPEHKFCPSEKSHT